MPRSNDPERRALNLLRKQAREGVPGAAHQLALAERRLKRDVERRERQAAVAEAQEARERSRATEVVGFEHREGYAAALLAWLATGEFIDSRWPDEAAFDAEQARWSDEYGALRYDEQDPVTRAIQVEMDAGLRRAQEELRAMDYTNQTGSRG